MFLAHFSNTSLVELMEMDGEEMIEWHRHAMNLHNKMNTPADNG